MTSTTNGEALKVPFPYFGGKSRVASVVWEQFGNVANYVEPFFGSGAILLARPHEVRTQVETVNDQCCFVSNFWRAIQHDPEAVASYADWPVNENDLHARHAWLVGLSDNLRASIEGDPDYYDAKTAGWWVWGMCCWIGTGFCSGEGPWQVTDHQLVHLGDKGQGINRKLVHLGNKGQGVNRQLDLYDWFDTLSQRLCRVRVCSGDWKRVMGESVIDKHGQPVGIFLDPPYSVQDRRACYNEESFTVAHDVREWCLTHGNNRAYRIALCGYEGEHDLPGWRVFRWKTPGGFGSQSKKDGTQGKENALRETIWFSPRCKNSGQKMLFDMTEGGNNGQ